MSCATCDAVGGFRETPYCEHCYAAALARVRDAMKGRKPDPAAAGNVVIRHIEPTANPRDRFAVAELAEQIGRAVAAAEGWPVARASVARAVGVAVTSKRMSAAVRQAEADGLIAVKRDGPGKGRGLYPGAVSVA